MIAKKKTVFNEGFGLEGLAFQEIIQRNAIKKISFTGLKQKLQKENKLHYELSANLFLFKVYIIKQVMLYWLTF